MMINYSKLSRALGTLLLARFCGAIEKESYLCCVYIPTAFVGQEAKKRKEGSDVRQRAHALCICLALLRCM